MIQQHFTILTKGIILENISVAIDGGHSMIKVCVALSSTPDRRVTFCIPTVVMPAISLSNENTRLRAEAETVELDGRKYFFGETALRQGHSEVFTGQNIDWIETTQHDVLIAGAWRKITRSIGPVPARIHLVMGLPAKYFTAQKDILKDRVLALLTPKLSAGQTLRVMVQSQADAPLQWLALNEEGTIKVNRDMDKESWGVIEIGHFTTDFALSERGSMIEHAVSSTVGMHVVYDALSSAFAAERLPTSIEVIETAIRTGCIKLYGEMRDVRALVERAKLGFESALMEEAERIFGAKASLLDGIVIGGGGADTVLTKIRKRFPTAISGEDPRMMVAEGFCRLGLFSLRRSQAVSPAG